MMKKRSEPIEIIEPPIQEIQRKKSCLGRSCSFSCLILIIIIIGIIVTIRFSAIARPKELRATPENFPKSIPVYDKDAISKITIISGKKKERAVQTAAKLPQIFQHSIVRFIEGRVEQQPDGIPTTWDEFVYMIEHDINDTRDTLTIEWKQLIAEPKFIQEYYKTNLLRAGYTLSVDINEDKTIWELHFSKDTTEGTLHISDTPSKTGTDIIRLNTLFTASE